MEKRIELEKRGRDPGEIVDLNLDNCRSTNIVGLTDDFKNLKILSLINVGLTSLKGFPKLPNLKKLELSDNRISNGLSLLHTSPKLTHLNLSGNKIKDLETLEPLKDFKHLKNLDLFNNDATSVENYREKLFNLIPSLKCLDGYDAKEQEVEDDSDDEEVNGNEEEDSEEDGEDGDDDRLGDDDDDDEDLDDEEIGLGTVYKENLEEESEGDDYEGEGSEEDEEEDGVEDEDDDVGEEEDGEEESSPRGKKRKHEGEEDV